ncbi:alcohol dehydrogenase catalytic domain-containing protein [Streptomyces caeruleatus]|uniref:Alcohol dehydrogenase n=1 Tax=Streptomyces caeruleatus TaxID=661399 RepID=A0A101TDW1_9ACTN|nr:alcohol dehydrogenase catalytic domain-containing protein [Streptomyces caeruleatus]KUN90519.1 alcohol dehydrogenase [Streptomyces caeruleatus]
MPATATHLAIVRHGTTCRIEEVPTPDPGDGELLLAPEQVSLCGTDIQILRRDRDDPSPVVGHEGAARVVAAGPGTDGFVPGDRVVVNPTHPGDPSFLLGHNVPGLFQQRVLIGASAVRAGLVSRLPDDLPAARATLVEPYAVVRYALSCLATSAPDTLVVHGDGLTGNLAALLAPRFLFPTVRVVVVHRTEAGLKWTQAHVPHAVSVLASEPLDRQVTGAVALLVTTHRGGTVPAVEAAVTALGERLVAVHPLGGVPPLATTPLLPGVDLDGVRRANTGGPWPPATTTFTRPGLSLTLSGNRGVTNAQLLAAAEALRADGSADPLLTHVMPLEPGVRHLNRIIGDRTRTVDGELVLRLVIDLGHSHTISSRGV